MRVSDVIILEEKETSAGCCLLRYDVCVLVVIPPQVRLGFLRDRV